MRRSARRTKFHEVSCRFTSTLNPNISVVKPIKIFIEPAPPLVAISAAGAGSRFMRAGHIALSQGGARPILMGPARGGARSCRSKACRCRSCPARQKRKADAEIAQRDPRSGPRPTSGVRSLRDANIISQKSFFHQLERQAAAASATGTSPR